MTGSEPNLDELLAQVQRMQDNLEQLHREADNEVEGSAGGGAVTVRMSPELEFAAVHIDPSVVDVNAVDLLEDLLLAALRDAVTQARAVKNAVVGEVLSSALSDLFGTSSPLAADDVVGLNEHKAHDDTADD